VAAILNKSGKKAKKVLKHKDLQFRVKNGQYLEIISANLLKEKEPR
jgi:hypothetical protein